MKPRYRRILMWGHVVIAALWAASFCLNAASGNWVAALASSGAFALAGHVAALYHWPVHVRVSRPTSTLTVNVTADTSEFKREMASLERRVKALDGALRRARKAS